MTEPSYPSPLVPRPIDEQPRIEDEHWKQVDTATWVYSTRFVLHSPRAGLKRSTEIVLSEKHGCWSLEERTVPEDLLLRGGGKVPRTVSPAAYGRWEGTATLVDLLGEAEWTMAPGEAFTWALRELRYAAYDRIAHLLETTKHLSRYIEERAKSEGP